MSALDPIESAMKSTLGRLEVSSRMDFFWPGAVGLREGLTVVGAEVGQVLGGSVGRAAG